RHINELREMGVTSLKIEGRMKRPEYVAAAVCACKSALDGDSPDMDLLRDLFSRGGFTDGYFTGNYADMNGVRDKEDVAATSAALSRIGNRFKEPYKRYKIDFYVKVKAGSPVHCTARLRTGSHDIEVVSEGEVPEKSLHKHITAESVISQMSKLGGTVFEAGKVEVETESGLMLKTSTINGLRREAVAKITRILANE
ncbi:MAG: U32 family peptidase, partial [Oscillospiraceae bacterium]|nr:U32 family peptidase [Oscillospiraceae bacterium]